MKTNHPEDCHKHHECGVCEPAVYERNNYFHGKLLTVRDFLAEQTYFNERRRLINRMVLGSGIVCGLDVTACGENLHVTRGLAIDCCGREILVCEDREIHLPELEHHCKTPEHPSEGYREELVLCLEYHECKTEEVPLPPLHCDEKEQVEFNRVRESFKFKIRRKDDVKICKPVDPFCPMTSHKKDHHDECHSHRLHEDICKLLKGGCPDCEGCDCLVLAKVTVVRRPGTGEQKPVEVQQEGGWRQAQVSQGEFEALCEEGRIRREPTESGESWRVFRDQQHSQPATQQDLEDWKSRPRGAVLKVDPCWKRRLVYNNTLLYQLIHCFHGDLPHIYKVDWDWNADAISFEQFEELARDGFTVHFDKKMKPETINGMTFEISVAIEDRDTCYQDRRHIPAKPHFDYHEEGECSRATFHPTDQWIGDNLEKSSRFKRNGGEVRILLRGGSILGQCGKALDGDWIAKKFPTGNGTQGGDFHTGFRVWPASGEKAD